MAKRTTKKDQPDFTGRLNIVEEPAELELWKKCAREKGVGLSAWVRMNLREAARKDRAS